MRPRDLIPTLLLAAALGAAAPLSATDLRTAPPPPDHPWCATGPATDARVEALDQWVRARERQLVRAGKRIAVPESRIQGDVILHETTPSSLPFHNPFDLVGRTLTFVPEGDDSFRVSTRALDYDENVGALLHTFDNTGSSGWHYRTVDLTSFTFPLGGASHSRLFVTAHNAIHFETPPLATIDQFTLLEALSLDQPIISPLLHTDQGTIFPVPAVFVKQTSDAVTVTWRSGPSEWGFALDVQARLEASGRVDLSYRTVERFDWGTVLVTTGEEPWRSERNVLHSQGSPAPPVTGTAQQMLDVRSMSIDRLGESNLIEITLTTAATLRQNVLSGGRYLSYYVELVDGAGNSEWINLHITSGNVQYRTPGQDWLSGSLAAGFSGNTVRMRLQQDALNFDPTSSVSFHLLTFNADGEGSVDGMTGSFTPGEWTSLFGSDLSTIAGATTVVSPVLEPFTLGVLNVSEVWRQLKAAHGFQDADIDGVAIYQDFFTDLILYAGAYSTVGNPGADGVSNRNGYGTQFSRRPALLHMNRVGYRWNADLPRSWHVTSHEFGHRWLYFINFDTGSGPSNALQPLGGHPAQYVHTPSAFPVYTNRDSSTMGGSNFLDRGSSFSTPDEYGYFGYSWHDLYLMGLATPEEVEDWYYIQNTSPALGGAYYPPPRITVTGTRRNVRIGDVVRAMGPRNPTAATSQKRFKVIYVLLGLPGMPPSTQTLEMLNEQRQWFERTFRVATGHRAEVDTTIVPVRRRGFRP